MLASDVIVGDWIIRTGNAAQTSIGGWMHTDNTYVGFPVKLLAVTTYHYMIWAPDRFLTMRQQQGSFQNMIQMYASPSEKQGSPPQNANEHLYNCIVLLPCEMYCDWVRADRKIVEWISKIIGREMFERLEMV